MEKKISDKVSCHIETFKHSIKDWVDTCDDINSKTKGELLEFVYDFNGLQLTKEDFTKRKRIKTHVPQYVRCKAKRACGEQCTRKRKEGNDFCGTHDKNRPHGIVSCEVCDDIKKLEVTLTDISGILYYVDSIGNVYVTEDVLNNKVNPEIYAKYTIDDGVFKII